MFLVEFTVSGEKKVVNKQARSNLVESNLFQVSTASRARVFHANMANLRYSVLSRIMLGKYVVKIIYNMIMLYNIMILTIITLVSHYYIPFPGTLNIYSIETPVAER